MGCSQSKIENEEAVARCKDRKHFMKQSVSVRNALAAAHSAYATYLKNTGAALTDFAEGEVQNPDFTSPAAVAAAAQQAFEIPLPPPPLPDFPNPLYRSATMPEIKMMNSVGTIAEVEDEEDQVIEEEEEEEARPPPPSKQRAGYPMQMQQMQMQQEQNAALEYFFPSAENMPGATLKDVEEIDLNNEEVEIQRKVSEEKPRRGIDIDVDDDGVHMVMRSERDNEVSEPAAMAMAMAMASSSGKKAPEVEGERTAKQNVNLFQIFTDLDDHFLKASESAHEVSKMLEATRLHYHSNFADNRGHINHSARVMRVITWNRSFRGIPSMDDVKDDFDSEEHETHATVLDKLLAWEKKLYDEVKAGELMKFEYQRKVATLNKLKKRGTNFEALEKAKATVSLLHTRYIVDMQSLDSTVSEINRLRDQELYPRLVELVDGMATMWRVMQAHHEKQSSIVTLLRSLDISQSPTETSEHHHDRTYQLLIVVQEWQSQFEKLVNNQRRYIKALSSWLKLNLIPIESNMKEKVSSPPRVKSPPIQILLHAWHDHLEKLPDELARTAIANFAAVIDSIFHQQEEELHLKRKCEETRKELTRKKKQFDDWESKYKQKKIPDEFDLDGTEGENDSDEVVREKRLLYEQVKRRLDEEEETYAMQCQQVRQKSLGSLKNRMPELFRAMSDFSLECSKMYRELKSKSQKLSSGQS